MLKLERGPVGLSEISYNKCVINVLTNLPLGPIYSFGYGPVIKVP